MCLAHAFRVHQAVWTITREWIICSCWVAVNATTTCSQEPSIAGWGAGKNTWTKWWMDNGANDLWGQFGSFLLQKHPPPPKKKLNYHHQHQFFRKVGENIRKKDSELNQKHSVINLFSGWLCRIQIQTLFTVSPYEVTHFDQDIRKNYFSTITIRMREKCFVQTKNYFNRRQLLFWKKIDFSSHQAS